MSTRIPEYFGCCREAAVVSSLHSQPGRHRGMPTTIFCLGECWISKAALKKGTIIKESKATQKSKLSWRSLALTLDEYCPSIPQSRCLILVYRSLRSFINSLWKTLRRRVWYYIRPQHICLTKWQGGSDANGPGLRLSGRKSAASAFKQRANVPEGQTISVTVLEPLRDSYIGNAV